MNFRLSISPQHGDRDIRKMSKISFGGSVEVGDPVSLANNGTIKFVDHHKSTKHQRERLNSNNRDSGGVLTRARSSATWNKCLPFGGRR